MKRFGLGGAAFLVLSACAGGPQAPAGFEPRIANPSAIISAEIAFARLAQEKGQWTAFRETAAKDAVMFDPQPNLAQAWLKGRADPPVAVKWQAPKEFQSIDRKTGPATGTATVRETFPGPSATARMEAGNESALNPRC